MEEWAPMGAHRYPPSRRARAGRLAFALLGLWGAFGLGPPADLSADGGPSAVPVEPMYEPRFRPGAPSDVLVSGPPVLARGHLDAFVDLLETAFDLSLGPAAEVALRDALEMEYEALGTGEREVLIELVARLPHLKDAARAGQRLEVTQGLNAFRTALDGRLRRAPARASTRVVEAALGRRSATAWPGDPAVHGSAADAWMEVAQFVLRLALNEAEGATVGQVEAMRERLREELAARPHAERAWLKDAHRHWLRARAAWDGADAAARTRMRWAALKLLNDLLPEERRVALAEGRDLPAYAREARRVRAGLDRFAAYGLLARNPARVRDLLEADFGVRGEGPTWIFLFRTAE